MIAVERDTTQSQRHCFIGSKSLCYGPDNSVRPTSGDRDAVKGIYYECRVGLGNKAQQVVRLGLRQVVTCWWLGLTVVLAEVEVEAREGTTQRIRVAEVLEAGRKGGQEAGSWSITGEVEERNNKAHETRFFYKLL